MATAVATLVLVVSLAVPAAGRRRQDTGLAAFDAVWQTIHDTHFDPTFGGVDWAGVRAELRPRAERAASVDQQRDVIRQMLARLGQSHFALLTAPAVEQTRGIASVPFDVRVTPGGVLVTRLHADVQLPVAPGDTLLAVDGDDLGTLLAGLDDPRADRRWYQVARRLSGAPASAARLIVRAPGGLARPVVVRRVVEPGVDVSLGHLPPMRAHLEATERTSRSGRRVGVIRFNVWMAAVAEPFAQAVDRFRGADGLIIDLRGNPGGLADMIRGIAGHVLDEPVLLGRMHMRGLDLEFRANPRRSTSDGRTVRPYDGPVAVLVDELSASASECFAGGLQAIGRARIFGVRSAGQALPAATRRLATGDVLLYAVGDFVTPIGRRLEGLGVVPDEVVPPTPADLAAGRDAEEAAIAWIDRAAGPT